MVTSAPPLVAMLPTVAPPPASSPLAAAPPSGEWRISFSGAVRDETARAADEAAFRKAFAEARSTSEGVRIAALCAVRGVRAAGARDEDGVDVIESATLEVVGRVAVKRLEVLAEQDAPVWEDDDAVGGTSLVAAVGGSAVLQDAWVDEIGSSPVHTVHHLRPIADECGRHHDAVRALLRGTEDELDIGVDRSLADAADAAMAAAAECDFGQVVDPVLDAYGDPVETPEEIDELRATSFAAWRALRPPRGAAAQNDVLWAFGTRSTEERLRRARDLLFRWRERLEG